MSAPKGHTSRAGNANVAFCGKGGTAVWVRSEHIVFGAQQQCGEASPRKGSCPQKRTLPEMFQQQEHRQPDGKGEEDVLNGPVFSKKIGASDTKLAPTWSEWRDSNSRPLGPEPSALPNCATPRKIKQPNYYITQDAKKSRYRAAKLRTFADFASPAAFSLASASGLWYAEARQRLRRGVVLWIACTAQD